ncbi:hypothetical protein RB195_010243 [Necator americanus]|uniref:Uncharacterized protein n=1 Tax=Necator americanus TaxID=51031 RepID=A0ABR1CYC2_NECAM
MARVRLSVSENVSLRVRRRKGDVYGVIDRVEATFCDCKAYQLLPPTKTIGFLHSLFPHVNWNAHPKTTATTTTT